jgi:glycosyltransferase involved in cell wall biosynthesis
MAKAGALGRVAAAEAGVPGIVHTYHGHVLDGYFPRFVEGRFLQVERWLATRSHALIAVSSAVRDSLLEKKIGTSSQWSVIPEIPDLCSLIDLVPSKARKTVSIGIVGRLTAIKDHMTFLRAMVHVAASSPECRFLIIGDGELRAPLMEAAKPLGESVRFLGWVENLAEIYSDLDIVVLTSRNEGLPLTLMEASAASLPTVATDVGGVSDVVKHGKTGFLVRAGDSDEIAERVLQLVRSPELRSQFGAAGRQWVRTEFSAQRLVAQVASLYDSLIRS